MSSWGIGSEWLRDGRRQESDPSVVRGLIIAFVTLAFFFLLVVLASSLSACSSAPASGIRGVVTIGPTEPVATAGTSSAGKPYATTLMITEQGGQHLKRPARVKSGADGTFSVSLEPGTYVIEAASQQSPPTLKPVTVKVAENRYTEVDVEFDSGIR